MARLPLCGKPLSSKDRKVWQQAIAMLMGLKVRNGFGKKDLAGAVERALQNRGRARCEDCRIKVASVGLLAEGGEQTPPPRDF